MAGDPAAFLMQALGPFLQPSSGAVRDQVRSLVSKTIQVTEARARAGAEAERSRALDSLRAAEMELQAMQMELQEPPSATARSWRRCWRRPSEGGSRPGGRCAAGA
ncbi:unnamed protein product [Prorocentrum cordatum]|uniref:Uncharacterized protein n=1 Tax=Prorocentrum cordatum TaxID=2364126 RepID=A0ABN9TK01_9DINO|nr:unnamed protein product [Polarella glacialis]